jgi:hypothetical protein
MGGVDPTQIGAGMNRAFSAKGLMLGESSPRRAENKNAPLALNKYGANALQFKTHSGSPNFHHCVRGFFVDAGARALQRR